MSENKKTIKGEPYGFKGDFVIEEMNFGEWSDMTDAIAEATTSVVDGKVSVVPKSGLFQYFRIKYGVKEAPVPLTRENIRNFPMPLVRELESAIAEVNGENLPFVETDIGMEMQ